MKEIAGKYLVQRKLGEGATGEVYLVQHKDLQIRLALKILRQTSGNDPVAIKAFKQEAELLFRFSHEGCVQLRDFGYLEDGSYFMATDFIEGGTLRDLLLRTGRLSPEFSLKILLSVLDVLGAAHKRGIIHRDIKPENIIIERSYDGKDCVRVLDFGLAQLLERQYQVMEVGDGVSSAQMSGSAGTPEYMAPEQILGEEELDGRVDIYASAIMAYEMLVGHTPFRNEDMLQVLLMQATEEPDPFPQGLAIDSEIEEVIFKALAKDRNDRFESVKAFADECRRLVDKLSELQSEVTSGELTASKEREKLSGETDSSDLQPTEKAKILILDDDSQFLDIISYILEARGYTVLTANNPEAMHTTLFSYDVDLLILDVQMPQISGGELSRMLKESLSELRIVLFSNLPERELEAIARDSWADGYVSKAIAPAEWLSEISRFLSMKPRPGPKT